MPLPYKIRPKLVRYKPGVPHPERQTNPQSFSKVTLFNVLEAAAIHDDLSMNTLTEIAGYCYPTTFYAITALIKHGWAIRLRRRYSATESGKIALAIHRGREAAWAARCGDFNAKTMAAWQRGRQVRPDIPDYIGSAP